MRILLCVPPFYRMLKSHGNSVHLGLGYLSAMLRKEGHEVKQVNFDFEPSDQFANQKQLFEENEHYRENIEKRTDIWGEITMKLARFKPDVVGINVFSSSVRQAEIIAQICKKMDNPPVVIVGGPMPTIAPEFLESMPFDRIVGGQAEHHINDIVKYSSMQQATITCPPPEDLNGLPFPDRHNYLDDYRCMNLSPLITQRGCNRNCRGCAHRKMGGKLRWRSTGDVLTEMLNIVDDYGVKFFRIFDDFFSANKERVIELCREMSAVGRDVTWLAETRLDALDPELLKIMADGGCVRLKVGIESGSPKMLKWLRKGVTVKQIIDSCKIIKDVGIDLTVNVMFGMRGETNKDLQKTIDLCKTIDADYVTISSYCPYPGTDTFEMLSEEQKKDYMYFTHTMKHPVLNDKLDQGLIDDLLNINEGKKRV